MQRGEHGRIRNTENGMRGAVRTSVTLVVQYIGNTVVVSGYVFVVVFLVFSGGHPPEKN
jgi:hypothetical protein